MSEITLPSPLWILDIEASGLDPRSYPIEIGVVGPSVRYQCLIRPESGWIYWHPEAEKLHGIPREALWRDGVPAEQVAVELNHLLANSTVYSDCQVWDQAWLGMLFGSVGVSQRFRVEDLTALLSGEHLEHYLLKHQTLQASGKYRLHRALDDAELIHEALTSG